MGTWSMSTARGSNYIILEYTEGYVDTCPLRGILQDPEDTIMRVVSIRPKLSDRFPAEKRLFLGPIGADGVRKGSYLGKPIACCDWTSFMFNERDNEVFGTFVDYVGVQHVLYYI